MQQIDTSLPYKIIYSLGEHPYLGYLLEPHIVQCNANGTLSLSYKRVFSNTIEEFTDILDETDIKIIALLDEIEQSNVIKKYHKKAIRPLDFFTNIFDDKIRDYLRPKIERQLLKVLDMIGQKPLYLMSKTDGYPAEQKLEIAEQSTSILFHFRRNETETRYFPTLKHQGHRMEFMFKGAQIIINTQAWLLLDNVLYYFDQPLEGKKLTPFLNKRYISVPRSTEKKYYETFIIPLIEKYSVYAEGFDIHTIKENATAGITLHYVSQGQSYIQLNFRYGEYSFHSGLDQHPISVRMHYDEQLDQYSFTRVKRSSRWEENQHSYLEQLGLVRQNALFGSYVTNNQKYSNVIEWLNEYEQELVDKGFTITQETGDKNFFIGKTSLDIEVVEDNDWFDVRAFANFGPYKIPFIQLRDHILNRVQEFTLPNGEIAIIPEEWFSKYEHLFHFAIKNSGLQLNKAHIGILHEISEHTQLTMSRKLENLSNFEQIANIQTPEHFKGSLRAYQQAGYNWFHFLQEFKFGGVLADDMGLGKTVQTLALLQKQKEELKNTDYAKTSLLVLPTSLVYNWQKEAEKFAPELRILMHVGSNRVKDPYAFSHFDLIITTYGIVRSDEELLGKFFFNYIILDESQNIKNPTSKSFKSIKTLKSRNKLALSGTPIENSVSDIWSQMHFSNPGLLGGYSFFQKEFVTPIEKKKDEDKARRLQAIIKPFVLRRTKDQVATELPAKTEQIIFCEMDKSQAELYESTKSEYRNALLDEQMSTSSITGTSQIAILQGLTKLRQLANHPRLVDAQYEKSSGKFQAVINMLDSISNKGHKVLIFSQFVKHLEIFKSYFTQENIPFAYLDGSTKDRAKAVAEFKENKEVRIFLISIKAGGVGLNLTEADYVFILDPWWNPAVENQAIDRSHRIGQKNNVFIYKFITKDTVEEKIVALQNRKMSIATSLITTEDSFVKSLSQDDLKELLR